MDTLPSNNIPIIPGISFLRSIMSIFVITWHVLLYSMQQNGGITPSDLFSKNRCSEPVYTILDLISFQILLVAVPTFVLISNYLFARNHLLLKNKESNSLYQLKKRIKRHLFLFSFWLPVFIIYMGHLMGFDQIYSLLPKTLSATIVILLSGGGSPYYFFFSLIFSLIITYNIRNLSIVNVSVCFAGSILLIIITPYITLVFKYPSLTAYWNPINFIPYSPLAILMARLSTSTPKYKIIHSKQKVIIFIILILIGLSIFIAIFEWQHYTSDIFFIYQGYGIPAYTRASIIFTSAAIMLIALHPSKIFNSNGILSSLILLFTDGSLLNRIFRFMESHSLALYCLHFYMIIPVNKLISPYIHSPAMLILATTILTAISSYAFSIILGLYLKDDLIR